MEMVTNENGLKHLYVLHVYTAREQEPKNLKEKVHAWIETQDLVTTELN